MDRGADPVTHEAERAIFLDAIKNAWDEPTPILIYSDWLEEHGDENFRHLRWYANEVHPAIVAAGEPIEADMAFLGPVYEWHKIQRNLRRQIAENPSATSLFRFGAIAICGLDQVRYALPPSCRQLVGEFRAFALGLTAGERLSDLRDREREIVRRICFGRYSPKAVASEFEPLSPDDAEVRLFALDAANPRANPTSIPKPFRAEAPRLSIETPALEPMLFWGALHRTLAKVAPMSMPEPTK